MKKVIKPLGVIFLIILIALTGCKKSDSGTNSENPSTPTIPTGVINGLFTINENGGQVYFSQGNLQYQASTDTWRFAEHQWDFVGSTDVIFGEPGGTIPGSSNHLISPTYSGWIDLFGWGTSGYNHGAVCYQPWSTGTSYSNYYAYDNSSYNLNDQTGQADWGYNPISNGGNQPNQWRTLTKAEWQYVFYTRSTPSGIRYAKAKVNNVNGAILLPDDWSNSFYKLSNINNREASFSSNTISVSQWNALEQHGAVFLPAAGCRYGTYGTIVYGVGSGGYYWSATCSGSGRAYGVSFNDSYLDPAYYNDRCYGQSVRLVSLAEN